MPPECAPPRALFPASRARVCSSLTTSRSISGTRRYFICIHDKSEVQRSSLTGAASTHSAASNVALFDLPKAISVCVRLVYLTERDVHKVVAVDEMSVERLPIFELDQLSKVNERNFALGKQ